MAAINGRLSVVQLLLSANADVNQASKVSESKLFKSYYSLTEVLFILLFNHGDDDGEMIVNFLISDVMLV